MRKEFVYLGVFLLILNIYFAAAVDSTATTGIGVIEPRTACTTNADCPMVTGMASPVCSGESSCIGSSGYECVGQDDGTKYCEQKYVSKCTVCANGCEDGLCKPGSPACAMPVCPNIEPYYTGKLDSNGCKIYECPSIACSMPVCKDGSTPTTNGKVDSRGCKIYTCPVNDIDAYLNQKFDLYVKQSAVVRDYKDMRISFIGVIESTCACPVDGPCAACVSKPGAARVSVSIPQGEVSQGRDVNIAAGEKVKVFDVTLSLIDISSDFGVFLVSKSDCPEGCTCTEQAIACPACQENYAWNPKTGQCESIVSTCPSGCVCTANTMACQTGTTTTTTAVKEEDGYFIAYWQCNDGVEEKQSKGVCLSTRYWKETAAKFCASHCDKDGVCGIGSFSLVNDCVYESDTTTEPTVAEPDEEVAMCKNSCPLEKKCYPFGYRKGGDYCADSGAFTAQLAGEEKCENSFECASNVCASGQCISQGLMNKIISWFRGLFGG